MKAVQYFSKEYLLSCQAMSIEERIEYLENFRRLMFEVHDGSSHKTKTKLISIKMPEDLLYHLKMRAQREGIPYQTLIKKLLRQAL
jgi:predicted DNA binding CopG/RHH family protein